ncbi:MAG: LemA family protein [Bacteroidales bacterium]|nr:LemA family protein [Bacteroidales bacterium]
MKKSNIIIISIVAFVAIVLIWVISTNNSLVSKDEAVKSAWSQVDNVYKRRADLVKQLTKIVEGAATYEKGVLTEVTNARAGVQQVKIDPSNPSNEQLKALEQADKRLMEAINVTVERYPELKATENFRDFQAQIEGSENRISTARDKFIKTVQEYNTKVRRFPSSIIAGIFGFQQREYFDAPKEAEEPADIEFNI